jgi:hypothetical protein
MAKTQSVRRIGRFDVATAVCILVNQIAMYLGREKEIPKLARTIFLLAFAGYYHEKDD